MTLTHVELKCRLDGKGCPERGPGRKGITWSVLGADFPAGRARREQGEEGATWEFSDKTEWRRMLLELILCKETPQDLGGILK